MQFRPMFQMSASACDSWRVDSPPPIDGLRRRLRAIMKRKDVKPTTLSLKVSGNPTLVKDLLEKTGDMKLSTVYRLAVALGVSVSDLLASDIDAVPVGPQLFVKGKVAAGQWVEAWEWPEDDWQILTGRSDVTADMNHRFFLRVAGDSMNLVYPEGTFIECVSVFGRAEILPGKRVVVVRRRFDQRIEATVKELVEMNGEQWLAPRSSNPAHQAFKLDEPDPEIEEATIIAVVVSSVRPE